MWRILLHGSIQCVLFPEIVPQNTLTLVIHAYLLYAAVCEEVCGKPNLFDDQLRIMETVRCMDDVQELIKQQDRVAQLEDRVKAWMKKVQEVYYLILRHCTGLHCFFLCCLYLVLTLSMLCTFFLDILFFLVWNYFLFEKVSEWNVSHHLSTFKKSSFGFPTMYCVLYDTVDVTGY